MGLSFRQGCPELVTSDQRRLLPDSIVRDAAKATYLSSSDWLFEAFSWSIREHQSAEQLEYLDVFYRGAGGLIGQGRRLAVRTWFSWDDKESRFPGNRAAEHLYLYLLERDGWPPQQVEIFVADSINNAVGPSLDALGAASIEVLTHRSTTVAWDRSEATQS